MTTLDRLRIVGWLLRDTFRQAKATWIFWLMLAVSGLCILVCASLDVRGGVPLRREDGSADFLPRQYATIDPKKIEASGVDVVDGELAIGWGAVTVPLGRDAEDAVSFVRLLLVGLVADTFGILLALVWTAGFFPAFLDPANVAVLLAKPPSRGTLFVGKYLGVLCFMVFQAGVFVGGTWLALGLRTGHWEPSALWALPLLVLHFGVFFAVSTLLAVLTRSTVTVVMGSIFFWLMCWGMNFGRHALEVARASAESAALAGSWVPWCVEVGYWLLPKPLDLGVVLSRAVGAERAFTTLASVVTCAERDLFLSAVASAVFGVFILWLGIREFAERDY